MSAQTEPSGARTRPASRATTSSALKALDLMVRNVESIIAGECSLLPVDRLNPELMLGWVRKWSLQCLPNKNTDLALIASGRSKADVEPLLKQFEGEPTTMAERFRRLAIAAVTCRIVELETWTRRVCPWDAYGWVFLGCMIRDEAALPLSKPQQRLPQQEQDGIVELHGNPVTGNVRIYYEGGDPLTTQLLAVTELEPSTDPHVAEARKRLSNRWMRARNCPPFAALS